jgi:two-component system chemotaxis response regulator CheB
MDDRAPTVVVVGASAGGVEALTTLADGLPEDLEAAVCVVLHLPAGADSRLAEIISRAGPLSATQANGSEPLAQGRIYVAPPDRHLLVRDSHVVVERGPHENEVRPSIDVLFRSASLAYGRRTVAVVLSGTRDDGVAGASAVGAQGGCVFVQDPEDALFATLPAYAVARDNPDRILPLAEIAPAVAAVVRRLSLEVDVRENDGGEMSLESAYAAVNGHGESVEAALWTAFCVLQERAEIGDRLAERVGKAGAERSRKRFEAVAEEARRQAGTIRRLLAGPGGPEG